MNTRNFEVTVAFLQLFLLGLWEALGAIYFGWSPFAIFLCWLVGLWTFNILTASALKTFVNLTHVPEPPSDNVVALHSVPDITEEDGVA